MHRISVIDSHTAGEPTRVVLDGIPDLGTGSVAERARVFRDRFDTFRSCVANEPRGSDILVGALLVPPVNPAAAGGVIFFNNVGVLGMCGHGTIGLVVTLAHLGRIGPGEHLFETPVGDVTATLHPDGRVSVRNVPSFRYKHALAVDVPGVGRVVGELAWGGNWFFLVADHGRRLEVQHAEELTAFAWGVRQALEVAGIAGEPSLNGGVIDHIELTGPALAPTNHGRNFVLCPGKAYDRSPCGTGTSAKLACLAASGKLQPGEVWRQEGILGGVFEGTYEPDGDRIIPTITGTAFVTAEATLIVDPNDPLKDGVR
ncbi:MAG: proline racemase family protein [Fimbriiglobus sp.]|jgi:4-hydroxyproline epimerase|nr:proline racemase family protein [Fimbriiglobus sp.]